MTNRERIINTALCRDTDRAPYVLYLEAWDETLVKWEAEGGFVPGASLAERLGYDPGFRAIGEVNLGLCPAFPEITLNETENVVVCQNKFGAKSERLKSGETIPRFFDFPVKNRKDWERLKEERLDPNSSARFPANWAEICAELDAGDRAVQLGDFPYGLFGTARELMGVENLMLAFYDDPELVRDVMSGLTDLWLAIYEKVVRNVKVDCIHIWEDMSGKQGSLISMAMVREFMLPNYKRIRRFADDNGIPFIMLDTDGLCDQLIPLFLEGGVNLLMPFEVAAGSDVVRYRDEYPKLAMLGGIDKRELAKGRESIDRELRRIEPLLSRGGYFPALDHLIHPEITWANFCYYSQRLKEMIENAGRKK